MDIAFECIPGLRDAASASAKAIGCTLNELIMWHLLDQDYLGQATFTSHSDGPDVIDSVTSDYIDVITLSASALPHAPPLALRHG
jgi:hypothetical protein